MVTNNTQRSGCHSSMTASLRLGLCVEHSVHLENSSACLSVCLLQQTVPCEAGHPGRRVPSRDGGYSTDIPGRWSLPVPSGCTCIRTSTLFTPHLDWMHLGLLRKRNLIQRDFLIQTKRGSNLAQEYLAVNLRLHHQERFFLLGSQTLQPQTHHSGFKLS